jgi:hypothetical protein
LVSRFTFFQEIGFTGVSRLCSSALALALAAVELNMFGRLTKLAKPALAGDVHNKHMAADSDLGRRQEAVGAGSPDGSMPGVRPESGTLEHHRDQLDNLPILPKHFLENIDDRRDGGSGHPVDGEAEEVNFLWMSLVEHKIGVRDWEIGELIT